MQRGEVWWCNLDPTIGAEQQKKCPCVIVNDDADQYSFSGFGPLDYESLRS